MKSSPASEDRIPLDEELEALEAGMQRALGMLVPAPPNAALMARLQASFPDIQAEAANAKPAAGGKILSFFRRVALPALAAAAAVTAAILWKPAPVADHTQAGAGPQMHPAEVPPVRSSKRVPLESRQHLMEVTDLGVTTQSGSPVRLVRTTWVDEILYQAQPGEEPVREGRVRQEIVPVALTSY